MFFLCFPNCVDVIFNPAVKRQYSLLENAAIANALQLEAARATPAPSRFNYDAMPSLKSLNIHCLIIVFLLLMHYFTL